MTESGQRERILRSVQETYGVEAEHLWARYPDYAVFRHPASGKWFAAFLDTSGSSLGLEGTETARLLNVKCSPMMIGSLLFEPGFLPAWHMSKSTWISVLLDGTVEDGQIAPLLA